MTTVAIAPDTTTELPDVLTEQAGKDDKLEQALAQVRALADASVDAVIPQRGLRMVPADPTHRANGGDPVYLQLRTEGQPITARVLEGAHQQFADRLGINLPYYRRMLADEPRLLSTNVNTWLGRSQEELRMVRMVKPMPSETGAEWEAPAGPVPFAVRAYLSDGYKVIDHYSVLRVIAPELQERNAVVQEFNLSQQRFHIRVMLPLTDMGAILAAAGRRSAPGMVNEVLGIGVNIRNSETGHSKAAAEVFAWIRRCANGMLVDEALGIAHLGKRQAETPEWMSDDTRRLTDIADVMRLRDRVRAGFQPERQVKVVEAIADAQGVALDQPDAPAVIRFIQTIGARYDLTKAEQGALADTTLAELAQAEQASPEATRWTASQAFTALARNTKATDWERGVDLERIGWKVLTDPVDAFLRAGKAGHN